MWSMLAKWNESNAPEIAATMERSITKKKNKKITSYCHFLPTRSVCLCRDFSAVFFSLVYSASSSSNVAIDEAMKREKEKERAKEREGESASRRAKKVSSAHSLDATFIVGTFLARFVVFFSVYAACYALCLRIRFPISNCRFASLCFFVCFWLGFQFINGIWKRQREIDFCCCRLPLVYILISIIELGRAQQQQ